jgi:DNA polymerase-4
MGRVVAHLDLDAFFAAVEVLEHPELAGVPLVVGGNPEGRGVVATASYEARRFGVRSAMSAAEARRRCPDAVFVRPDMATYRRHSRRVWALVGEHCAAVEQVGIDEGYLDLSDAVRSSGAARDHLRGLQGAIRAVTGLSASFGCGTSKVVAKIASDRDKPAGVTVVPAGGEAAFLAPLPLRALPGVGPKSEARLGAAGLRTVGELAALADADLQRLLPGVVGVELRDRARGIDPRPVAVEPAASVSIGYEETFDQDVTSPESLRREALRMSERVAERLARDGRRARTVTVKVRYPDFQLRSRSASSAAGVELAGEIGTLALQALERALADRPPPVRLLGVSVSRLGVERQLVLELEEEERSGPVSG